MKSRLSKTAKAVYALNGRRKWALTGLYSCNIQVLSSLTLQVHRSLTVLRICSLFCEQLASRLFGVSHQSYRHFLDFKPWSDYSFFRSWVLFEALYTASDLVTKMHHITLPRQRPQGNRRRSSYLGERATSKTEEHARQRW
jgi:hypothetical protein